MNVGDYVSLWDTETSFGKPQRSRQATQWLSGMDAAIASPLRAVREAPPAQGRFPVVVYAPGLSNPSWDNADFCEHLASHGYLVVASPSLGATSREMTLDLIGIDAQARDILFLIDYAQTLANANTAQIAVTGYSWGGISNLFAAARDERIRALICLDGNIRFSPGLIWRSQQVQPERMTIPLLSISQGQWTIEDQDREIPAEHQGPSVLNAWQRGDLITVHMLGLSHMEHASMYQRNEDVWWRLFNLYHQKKADYGREDGATGYAWMARYALEFLNAYLQQDAQALAFLKRSAAANGAPKHFMAVRYRAAAKPM